MVYNLDNSSSIVTVDVSKCRDWLGYSYTNKGWHYLCAAIKEFIDDSNIYYKDSLLKEYYQSYQPKSIHDLFFYDESDEGIRFPAISNNTITLPWGTAIKIKENNQHFGPNSDSFMKKEFFRTMSIYKKIAKEGYQPDHNRDGYIRGHFLKRYHDYRFMLAGGQHRMAVLGVLNYKNIQVKIQPKWERIIDIEDVQYWPYVKNGTYDRQSAIKIFNSYFQKNGREKAKKLNLLD